MKKSSDRNEDASLLKTVLRMFGFQYSMITGLLFIEVIMITENVNLFSFYKLDI